MKHIFYLLDGFSPLALKKQKSQIYKNKKQNYIDTLSDNSLFFENCYGYGETYPTVYSMINGQDIYKSYCDAPEILSSFKENYSLLNYYKSKNYKTIYFRNVKSHYPTHGFYKRFNKSFAEKFDYYCLKKENQKFDLKNFMKLNKFFEKYKKDNIFYFIHDMSFHDNQKVYDGSINQHLNALKYTSNIVKKNLKILNYNKSTDTLFFLSDHGLSAKPFNKIHTQKFLKNYEYENYYKSMFLDEKIKFTFFIKSPNKHKKKFTQFLDPQDVFNTILYFNRNKFKKFVKKTGKHLKKSITISLKNARGSIYGNFILKNIFHFHFIKITLKEKFIYSYKHKDEYIIERNGSFKKVNMNSFDKEFLNRISNYYGKKNLLIKSIFFLLSFAYKVPSRIIKKLFK